MASIADTDAGCRLSELARFVDVSRRADGQDPREVLAGGVRSELDRVAQNRTDASCRMKPAQHQLCLMAISAMIPSGMFKHLSKRVAGDVRLRIGGIEHPADTS